MNPGSCMQECGFYFGVHNAVQFKLVPSRNDDTFMADRPEKEIGELYRIVLLLWSLQTTGKIGQTLHEVRSVWPN